MTNFHSTLATSTTATAGVQQLSRTLDKVFEDAQLTGQLCLSFRNLRDLPNVAQKYDLSDTQNVDLSNNRLAEVPELIFELSHLEYLVLNHNILRSIGGQFEWLTSLTYLDLSGNQLTSIPGVLCTLPLEMLLLGHNRLDWLPMEIRKLEKTLMELDVSCNRLTRLPNDIGFLKQLRVLNVRQNLLTELPYEMCNLKLSCMDASCNKISTLFPDLRLMTSLVDLNLDNNPLVSPPARLCRRGPIHIFKYLEDEANKRLKRSGLIPTEEEFSKMLRNRQGVKSQSAWIPTDPNDVKFANSDRSDTQSRRRNPQRHTVADSGYSTNDETARWSRELQSTNSGGSSGNSANSTNSAMSTSVVLTDSAQRQTVRLRSSSANKSAQLDVANNNYRSLPRPHANDNVKLSVQKPVGNEKSSGLVDEVLSVCMQKWSTFYGENNGNRPDRDQSLADDPVEPDTPKVTPLKAEIILDFPTPTPSSPILAAGHRLKEFIKRKDKTTDVKKRKTSDLKKHFLQQQQQNSVEEPCSPVCVAKKSVAFADEACTSDSSFESDVIPLRMSPAHHLNSNNIRPSPPRQVELLSVGQNFYPTPRTPSFAPATSPIVEEEKWLANNGFTPARKDSTPPADPNCGESVRAVKTPMGASSDLIASLYSGKSSLAAKVLFTPNNNRPNEPETTGSQVTVDVNSTEVPISTADEDNLCDPCENSDTCDSGIVMLASPGQESLDPTVIESIAIEPIGHQNSELIEDRPLRRSITPPTVVVKPLVKIPPEKAAKPSQNGVKPTSRPTFSPPQKPAAKITSTPTASFTNRTGSYRQSVTKTPISQSSTSTAVVKPLKTPTPTSSGRSSPKSSNSDANGSVPARNGTLSPTLHSRKILSAEQKLQVIEETTKLLESRLKLVCDSESLAETLSDGVHLCDLANQLRPRSIPNINVTSSMSPKLPAAKAKRNVENFLLACRRFGVPETALCSVADVLEAKHVERVAITILTLVKCSGATGGGQHPKVVNSVAAARNSIGLARNTPPGRTSPPSRTTHV